ncbi:MAG: hypothetical protein FWG66_13115 [Spirochaetes bacterium]|nr:hypothetical protein [Spirochaetota bacterium]
MARKKFLLGMLVLVFAMLAVGCVTRFTTPIFYAQSPGRDFVVLGEVRIEGRGVGFDNLMEEARRRYPNADFVVDVMVDERVTTTRLLFIFTFTNQTTILRGTAIQYVTLAEEAWSN